MYKTEKHFLTHFYRVFLLLSFLINAYFYYTYHYNYSIVFSIISLIFLVFVKSSIVKVNDDNFTIEKLFFFDLFRFSLKRYSYTKIKEVIFENPKLEWSDMISGMIPSIANGKIKVIIEGDYYELDGLFSIQSTIEAIKKINQKIKEN